MTNVWHLPRHSFSTARLTRALAFAGAMTALTCGTLLMGCGGPGVGSETDTLGGCSDGVDNDEDGALDCADTDCAMDPACSAACGNGVCDAAETPVSCPADCAMATCGDGVCAATEDMLSCPADCMMATCGNGTCEAGEDATNCAADCGGTGGCTSVADLLAQTGCTAPQACTIVDAAGTIACGPAGAIAAYGDCSMDPGGCAAGSVCAAPGATNICLPFCNTAAPNCPMGGLCSVAIMTNAGVANLCNVPANCDALNNTGCTGGACYILDPAMGVTDCASAGAGGPGTTCMYANDCLPSHYCLITAPPTGTCTELCDFAGGGMCSTGACMDPMWGVTGTGICM